MKNFLFIFFIISFLVPVNQVRADDVVYENPKFFNNKNSEPTEPAVKVGIGSGTKSNSFPVINIPEGSETIINAKPEEQPKVQTDCDKGNKVCLISYSYKNRIELEAQNKALTTYSMNIHFFLNNMKSEENSDSKDIILQAGEKRPIDVLNVIDVSRGFGYNYNFSSHFGIIDTRHDDNFAYDLPFDIDNKFMLIQGVGGRFSHNTEDQYYAYDFKMPIGTPVLAARDGIVVDIVQDFTEGGVNASLKNKVNYIYIQHDDGTIAAYAHLQYHGALVSVGDKIQKGQKIALSGDTGYTTMPHLHFGVFKFIHGGKVVSVPVKMKTSNGVLERLKPGEVFTKDTKVQSTEPKTEGAKTDGTKIDGEKVDGAKKNGT